MTRTELLCFSIISLLLSCDGRYTYEYYPNGNLKSKSEKYSGDRSGVYLEYFENGALKLEQHWVNGQLHGDENEYYSSGKLRKKIQLFDGVPTTQKRYFENGFIESEITFKKNGEIADAKFFKENGSRDSLAIPIFAFKPYFSDTLTIDEPVLLEVTIVNVTDSIFFHGTLIISHHLRRDETDFVIPLDTIQVVNSRGRLYQYRFTPTIGPKCYKGCS